MKSKQQPQTMRKHVNSRKLGKKLKELGVKRKSNFYWVAGDRFNTRWHISEFKGLGEYYPAYLASELGEMLPEEIVKPNSYCGDNRADTFVLEVERGTNSTWCYFYSNGELSIGYNKEMFARTEADARAKLLIYLISEGYYRP